LATVLLASGLTASDLTCIIRQQQIRLPQQQRERRGRDASSKRQAAGHFEGAVKMGLGVAQAHEGDDEEELWGGVKWMKCACIKCICGMNL